MTSGPRRIRVACTRCDHVATRTLKAGDQRTLETLRRTLRCGQCRAWASTGLVLVDSVGDAEARPVFVDLGEQRTGINTHAAGQRTRPRLVRAICLKCYQSRRFKPRWRRNESIIQLCLGLVCDRCGAKGTHGDIQLKAIEFEPPQRLSSQLVQRMKGLKGPASEAADMVRAGLLILALTVPGMAGAAAAGLLIGGTIGASIELVLDAYEYEAENDFWNSPRGGYRERVEARHRSNR